ncbi:hypothetical protein T4D_9948 [Trichinella pseudospiralis]|uniref:Uncharacterized protein n=1 Tax=Trichinella pseudospiralis TaxID=6337 RepID=A0A0V1G873_TRIPS|nr:hypothetical protein T4D_9948 [Trichinella pseudospiralis]
MARCSVLCVECSRVILDHQKDYGGWLACKEIVGFGMCLAVGGRPRVREVGRTTDTDRKWHFIDCCLHQSPHKATTYMPGSTKIDDGKSRSNENYEGSDEVLVKKPTCSNHPAQTYFPDETFKLSGVNDGLIRLPMYTIPTVNMSIHEFI